VSLSTLSLVIHLYLFFRLKKQYRAANERIGKTGAGLNPEDIVPGSEIANLIGSYLFLSRFSGANETRFREGDRVF
jgi:hypothetical protein